MPRLKSARAPAADAAAQAALMLGDAHSPLIVADQTYRSTQVLRQLRARGCGRRARCVRPRDLAEAAVMAADAATVATVAGAFASSAPARLARVTRMQAEIHCFLARQASSFAGLKSASILARTLADMEDHLDCDDPFAKIDKKGSYAVELEFLSLLWQDKASAGQRRRRDRLLEMAASASQPLAYVCFHRPPPLFREFLEKWQQPSFLVEIELDETARRLDELWQQGQPEAGRLRDLPLDKLSVCAAETTEDAARSAFAQISAWLAGGVEKIGIVAYDRALARRVNSACNAAGIYLEDKTGWAADSLLVGNCLLAAAQLATTGDNAIDNLVQALCVHLDGAGDNWSGQVRNWQRARDGELARLADDLKSRPRPANPSQWLEQIAHMAAQPPLERFFADDHAATLLISYLRQLANEFEDFAGSLSGAEMLGLLRESIARLHLPAAPANCPLHIIAPSRVVDEPFDALLLLGANASTLPGIPEHFAFNETVRRELGLPTREDVIGEIRRSSAALLAAHASRECLAVSAGTGPSPYLELLVSEAGRCRPAPPAWQHRQAGGGAICERRATIPAGLRPEQMSPSGADTLMACPYKFFVESLLQARKEETAYPFDRARFGQIIHAILKIYHDEAGNGRETSPLSACARVLAEAPMEESERQLLSWRLHPLLEKYGECFAGRRAQDWKTAAAEKRFAVQLDAELQIELAGSLDLLEENGRGEKAVCDIKTGAISRSEVLRGEKPQLMLYAHMAAADPRQSFLRIARIEAGRAKIEDLGMKGADSDLAERMFARLQMQARQMFAAGRALPANGADKTCRNCAAAGMCRKPHWGQPH